MPARRSSPSSAAHADARPRIHVWRKLGGWQWSLGPGGARSVQFVTIGRAIDEAARFAGPFEGGAVIVVEGIGQ
jgi:hypothetical protein